MRHQATPAIAVDVDGTLLVRGACNAAVVRYCEARKAEGAYLILWSARGVEHARAVAAEFGVTDLFDAIIPKPGAIIDDKGWSWVRHTLVIPAHRIGV